MSDADESELIRHLEAARSGDPDASRALVEALYPLVLRIVRSHRPRQSGEEDLAQEVFLKLLTRLDRYQPRDGIPFAHWVSRLAVRTCLDQLRSERRRPEIPATDLSEEEAHWIAFLTAEAASTPDAGRADFSAVALVQRLLGQLSPDDRLVIQWLDLDQKTAREVSDLTGWSRTAVKVRAFRARRRLRRLAESLQDASPRTHEYF
ncbi:MAG: sigma-70 family RNA polymerase sigma factor [Verrucomicrobia bacterium]|nr:sigma-70 family RNA polymerase sigma factor [Verrucomicrobiota bacterium]